MNEFSSIKSSVVAPVSPTVLGVGSTHTKNTTGNLSGKGLPPEKDVAAVTDKVAEPVADQKNVPDEKTLSSAVSSMNEFAQTVQRNLHFYVDEDSQKTVVKVVDGVSGDIIRQIPDESFLELARKMKEEGDVHFISAKG